jgi:hypothetical protein
MNILSRRAGNTQHIFTPYLRANKKLLYSFGVGIGFILFLLYTPIGQKYFGFGPLSVYDRLLPIG